MNKLDSTKRGMILRCLTEGNSIRGTARLVDCSINTVVKLMEVAGEAAHEFHNEHTRNLHCARLQIDEIWSFVGKKQSRTTAVERQAGIGDAWTWITLCADSRLIVSYYVGERSTDSAMHLLYDSADRVVTRPVQCTTDGLSLYLHPMRSAFLGQADFAQLQKIYGQEVSPGRYSPAQFMGSRHKVIEGNPDMRHVSTSYVERQNLTLRMCNRRFTRLTNAHSKKLENLRFSVALYAYAYNYCRINEAHRVTPAMEAGCCTRVCGMGDLLQIIDAKSQTAK